MKHKLLWNKAVKHTVHLFSGELSQRDMQHIDDWQQQNPDHQQHMQSAIETWSRIEPLANDPDIVAIAQASTPPSTAERILERGPSLALAATLLLGVLTVFSLYQFGFFPGDTIARYSTVVGERKDLSLPDGTRINMNTASLVIVDFTDEYRRAVLDRGEAFFDVAKDPERPFIVEVGGRGITVLGTQFNVQKNRELLTVAVVEGVVALHPKEDRVSNAAPVFTEVFEKKQISAAPADQYRLEAGAVIALNDNHQDRVEVIPVAQAERFISWRTGSVRFEQQPLYKVIQEINRYTERKILIEDASIMNLSVNAVLRLDKIDSILVGLEASLPIKVKRYYDSVVIVGG